MPSQIMLVPNPSRSMQVDRVIVLDMSGDKRQARVLSIDALGKSPSLLRAVARNELRSVAIWRGASTAVFIAGVALSFLWHWWAFLAGLVLAGIIYRTQHSIAAAAIRAHARNPEAFGNYFTSLGLVWVTPADRLMPGG